MKLTDLDFLSYLAFPFGGPEAVSALGVEEKLARFLLPPYEIRVVKPWAYFFDLRDLGYRPGQPFYVYDSDFNFLYRNRVTKLNQRRYIWHLKKEPPQFTQQALDRLTLKRDRGQIDQTTLDTFSGKVGQVLDQDEQSLLESVEDTGSFFTPKEQDLFWNTPHGEFVIVQFKDWESGDPNFLALWVCKQLDPSRREQLLQSWREQKRAVDYKKSFSYIKLCFPDALPKDRLEVNVVAESLDAFLTREEVETHEDVVTTTYDHLTYDVIIYPDRDWWVSFNLLRDGQRFPLQVDLSQQTRVKAYMGSYFIQVSPPKTKRYPTAGSIFKESHLLRFS